LLYLQDDGAVAQLGERLTGSQKVEGPNPSSSTKETEIASYKSNQLLISSNSYTQLAIPLYRLFEGFLLFCKVENKSPATISFYKDILDKFQWYLQKFDIETIDATTIRSFLNKAIVYMFLDTGLRLSELANLHMTDINMEQGIIKVVGKGDKERLVRIGIKSQKALWNYLAHRPIKVDHVWLGRENAPFTVDGIAQMIRNLGKRYGIRLSPHKLRHSFAISFLRNGANPFELQIALGHTTLEMTRRYTQALGFDDVFKRHIVASPMDRLGR